MKRSLLFACLLSVAALPVEAQNQAPKQNPPLLLDRIVAVVADTILLNSDIEEQLAMLKASGQPVPTDSAGLLNIRRQIIDGLIEKLVLLHAAKRDTTVKVDDSKVDAEVERQVEQRKQQFGGEVPFETALRQQHLTLAQFKDMLGADVRKEMMQQLYLQKVFGKRKPPPLTEKALQDEFEKSKASLQERPATISFTQVVMSAAYDAAKKVARVKADSILGLIRAGQDFATLAKRFSD